MCTDKQYKKWGERRSLSALITRSGRCTTTPGPGTELTCEAQLDENGNYVLDENGDIICNEVPVVDENGDPVLLPPECSGKEAG